MGSKTIHLAHSKKLQDRAEECRTLARLAKVECVATSYVLLADEYDQQAQGEAALAGA